jgi:DNA-binding MltR family transcriptional regulator
VSEANSDSHFLDHLGVKELFSAILTTMVAGSDCGAVLVGTAHVDNHLRRLFERFAPDQMGQKRREAVLNYPGPLASLSAKADVAFFVRLINAKLHAAIHHLRQIRNGVAHSPESFRLADHATQLRGMYNLGPGVPMAIIAGRSKLSRARLSTKYSRPTALPIRAAAQPSRRPRRSSSISPKSQL